MPDLTPGTYKLTSCIEGNPLVGVDDTKPASQTVHLNGTVTTWEVAKGHEFYYRLSVKGYSYTGIDGNKVTATTQAGQNVDWYTWFNPVCEAYAIASSNDVKGWTVPDGPGANPAIVLESIQIAEDASFLPTQSFLFLPLDE